MRTTITTGSVLALLLGIAAVTALIAYSIYLSVTVARTKREMQCIVFESQGAFLKLQGRLAAAQIFFTFMEWTPSQVAYQRLGNTQHTPKELWILKSDSARVKQLIEAEYRLEVSGHAFIVHSSLGC